MRERLVELYHNIEIEYLDYLTNIAERAINDDIEDKIQKRQGFYVDKLLANGVIVPPCKVGQILYCIESGKILECKVSGYKYCSNSYNGTHWHIEFEELFCISEAHIGEIVFYSREEAEQALKGGEQDV